MDWHDETVLNETRRQLLGRGARGLGSLALFSLLQKAGLADAPAAGIGALPGLAPLRSQGEAGDLSSHAGRASADGDFRLQARDGQLVR